jgi:hypothetical protein
MVKPPSKPPAPPQKRRRLSDNYTHPSSTKAAAAKSNAADAGGRPKEVISIPAKQTMPDASKQTRAGHPSGARAMADMSVAVREGLAKKKPAAKPAFPPKKPKGKNDPAF